MSHQSPARGRGSRPDLAMLNRYLLVLFILGLISPSHGSVTLESGLRKRSLETHSSQMKGAEGHSSQMKSMIGSSAVTLQDNRVSSNVVKEANCSRELLNECLSLLQTLSSDHNLAFAANITQLDDMCSTMRAGLHCMHNHVSRCFKPDTRQRINALLDQTQMTVKMLCMDGSFRDRYLQHASCMRIVSTNSDMCGPHYQKLVEAVELKDKLSAQETIRMQCCSFHTYLACVSVAAQERCGEDARKFVEEYSYKTAGSIILTRCRGYVPGTHMCIISSAAESLLSLYTVTVIAAMIATIAVI